MGRLWALTFTPVTCDFRVLSRGATVDTPFLTDLETQTSPVERLVILHNVLVQKFQSLGSEPCLRTSEPSAVPWLGLRTRLGFLCFFFLRGGRGPVDHLSVAVGYIWWPYAILPISESGFRFFGTVGRVPRFGTA